MAHSLGNMLVSSAIKDCELTSYAKYYMLNAAVPMEAYDVLSDAAEMVDSAWSNVPVNYRASDWSALFATNDFRASLSWRGRFAGIQNAVNCYSTTEDILDNPTLHGVGGWWSRQELFKGTSTLNAINALSLGSLDIACEGGWGINTFYALSPTVYTPGYGFHAAAMEDITHDDAIGHPLFTPFRSEENNMHSTNLFTVADEAYRKNLRAKLLGDAIPATSFASGRNATSGGIDNIPLIQSIEHGNLWPEKNGDQPVWKHSALKNVAYFFVHNVFDGMVNEQ